jgi:hypothetical protein
MSDEGMDVAGSGDLDVDQQSGEGKEDLETPPLFLTSNMKRVTQAILDLGIILPVSYTKIAKWSNFKNSQQKKMIGIWESLSGENTSITYLNTDCTHIPK